MAAIHRWHQSETKVHELLQLSKEVREVSVELPVLSQVAKWGVVGKAHLQVQTIKVTSPLPKAANVIA